MHPCCEICTLAQISCIEDVNGNPKFLSTRPVLFVDNGTLIKIPRNNQYSKFDKSLILNNKIKTVGYDKTTYSYDWNQVYLSDSSQKYYEQTDYQATNVTLDGENKGTHNLYNGLLSSYSYELTNNSNNFQIVGLYSFKGYSPNDYTSEFYVYGVYSASFKVNTLTSKLDSWFVSRTQSNGNTIWFGVTPSSTTNKLLLSKQNIGIVPIEQMGKYNYQFVSSESEALSNLITSDGFLNGSYGDLLPIQLIKDGDMVTAYFYNAIPIISGYKPGAYNQNYNGDLTFIILNDNTSVYCKELKINTTKLDENANIYINSNNILVENTTYDSKPMTSVIKENILKDYKSGISNGSITISCSDYYDFNGNKIIDSLSGDTIQVGQMIKIDGDNKTWRVTGAKLRKKGCPFVDLQVIEVKNIISASFDLSKCFVSINRISSQQEDAKLGIISVDDAIYKGDVLQFNVTADTSYKECEIQKIQITSPKTGKPVDYANNSEYVVTRDITFNAIAYSWEQVTDAAIVFSPEYSTNLNNSHFEVEIDGIVADRDIRLDGRMTYSTNTGYYPETDIEFNNLNSLELGNDGYAHINIYSSEDGSGEVIGEILFAIRKPISNRTLIYENYSSVGDNAYIRRMILSKIEQFK